MVKIVITGSAIVACLTFAVVTSASQAGADQKKKPDATRDTYVANCQMCHGVDGKAPVPEMSFVGRKWKTKTAAEAAKVISEGVPGTPMLPFEGKLTKDQIRALARYVRALDTPAARKKK
jgi:mono/diheme cytochrome c family protein